MRSAANGLAALLALAMVSTFVRKLRRDDASERLRTQLLVAPALWQVVGVLELAAAVGLLAGIAAAPLGVAAAVGIALLMLGAVLLHLRVGMGGLLLVAPAVLLVAGAASAGLRLAAA